MPSEPAAGPRVVGADGRGPDVAAPTGVAAMRAVSAAVEHVFDRPPGAVGPAYPLTGADSIDLVEIADLVEAQLGREGFPVRLDDATLPACADVAALTRHVAGALRV